MVDVCERREREPAALPATIPHPTLKPHLTETGLPSSFPHGASLTAEPPPLASEVPPHSYLDPEETNTDETSAPQAPTDEELMKSAEFRHTFWTTTRERVLRVLRRTEPNQAARFDDCGKAAWVLRRTDVLGEYRIVCNRCHSRWCLACTGERRRSAAMKLQDFLRKDRRNQVRLLTLTLRTNDQPLGTEIDRLWTSFRRFRTCKAVRDAFQGGLAVLELTYSDKADGWHPHLHIVFHGRFLPQQLASREWHRITQDSYIVDVRALRGEGAVGYVCKYLGKSLSNKVLRNEDLLEVAITELKGRRTYATFGTWRQLKLSEPPDLVGTWEPLAPLTTILHNAASGDPGAREILTILRRSRHEPLDNPDSS
jgi:Replication protein